METKQLLALTQHNSMEDKETVSSLSMLEEILNTLQDLVFIVEVENEDTFKYMYANKLGMEHAGLDESGYGQTFQQILPAEVAELVQTMYHRAATSKQSFTYEDCVILEDGRKVYYESVLNPIVDKDGKCRYIVCITRNVTERVQEQAELQESEMRYKSILEYNLDSIISLDVEGRIIYANPATYKMYGRKNTELYNKYIFDFIPEQNKKRFTEIFNKALEGKSIDEPFYLTYHKNGYELYVHIKIIPIIVSGEIKGIYLVSRDITKQVRNERETEVLAYYDQLTGLFNRAWCTRLLSRLCSRKREENETFSLLYIDIDRFSIINDTFGHQAGDYVLKEMANRICEVVPKSSYVCRQGADQFAVLVEQIDGQQTEDMAKKILKRVQEPYTFADEDFYIEASIGIVLYPKDGENEKTLLKSADLALAYAKENGKGQIHFYQKAYDQIKTYQFTIENYLKQALNSQEFVMHYQPQVNILNGAIVGFEALLRWSNHELGNIPPSEFIPIAEKTGFIFKIDEWVIMEVCRQLREWMDRGYRPVPVSINVSAKQFRSLKIVETIIRALQIYDIPAHLLSVEITEGALMHEQYSQHVLKKLKDLGIQVHLDDFGTGYSALSYLKNFPIDTIKIDRSFIQEVGADERDASITTAIINLAHTLQLEVIAEGVENEEQIAFLKEKNAKIAQGYYYNKPIAAKEAEALYLRKT